MASAKSKPKPAEPASAPEAVAEQPDGGAVSLSAETADELRAYLRASEFSGIGDAGAAKCPVCKASKPLDEANAREWERHADDCALGKAIAALA